jgi:hypothetical protein
MSGDGVELRDVIGESPGLCNIVAAPVSPPDNINVHIQGMEVPAPAQQRIMESGRVI